MMQSRAVLASAPGRIDFTGGFADVNPGIGDRRSSLHISATIDRRVYVVVGDVRLWPDRPEDAVDITGHASGYIATARGLFSIPDDVHVSAYSQIDGGSGLGGSGALAVAMAGASEAYSGKLVTDRTALAEAAYSLERAGGQLTGRQDQYAAAYGGLRGYLFYPNGCTLVSQPLGGNGLVENLSKTLTVIKPHGSRSSSDVVASVVARFLGEDDGVRRALGDLDMLAQDVLYAISSANFAKLADALTHVGRVQQLLHASIIPPSSRRIVNAMMQNQTHAIKALGGGGEGACLLVLAGQDVVDLALARAGLPVRTFTPTLDNDGVRLQCI